jgi:hypothetical protein
MGIAESLKAKITRYPTGAAVMEHVINGTGRDIGFGATTEMHLYEPKGIKLVGPFAGGNSELHELRGHTDDQCDGCRSSAGCPAPHGHTRCEDRIHIRRHRISHGLGRWGPFVVSIYTVGFQNNLHKIAMYGQTLTKDM